MPKTGNIAVWLLDISALVIEFRPVPSQVDRMRHAFALLFCAALFVPVSAEAACYADYKAKQDNPLRLHYGVAEVGEPCTASAATAALQSRLAAQGWTLLNVMSVFGQEGLAERKESAGPHFLRY